MQTPHWSERQPLSRRIREFFYAEEVPFGIALVRMLLPVGLLAAMLPRWVHARELYSSDGASTPLWNTFGWPNLLPEPSGTLAVIFASVLIVALVTLALGWCARISAGICFVLYTYLSLLDATATMTKYSVIASHVLLLLSLSPCGAVWSIDAWLRRRNAGRERYAALPWNARPKFAAWPRRLLQLLIGYVYFGAAMTKIHTTAFFSGEQLQTWMLTNVNYDNPLGEYLSLYPALLVLMAYVTIVWEITFIFVCWRGTGRAIMLTAGVFFHIMTALTLGLYVFPIVCIAIYFAFLNKDDVRRLALTWRRWRRRLRPVRRRSSRSAQHKPSGRGVFGWLDAFPIPSPVVFGILLGLTAVAGVEAEYRIDPFGTRRPQGPYALKELDRAYVEGVLLAEPEEVRPQDVVAEVEAGTILIGGTLANHRRQFRLGELVIVQCRLNPPHKDMWLECALLDGEDRVVVTRPQPVTREMLRVSFPAFPLGDYLDPGRYAFVVKMAGHEVRRYSFTIRDDARRAAAN